MRKETRCRHMGYSFRLAARVLLYASPHRQDNTYHVLYYTSRGALAGTRTSSMGLDVLSLWDKKIMVVRWTSLSKKNLRARRKKKVVPGCWNVKCSRPVLTVVSTSSASASTPVTVLSTSVEPLEVCKRIPNNK